MKYWSSDIENMVSEIIAGGAMPRSPADIFKFCYPKVVKELQFVELSEHDWTEFILTGSIVWEEQTGNPNNIHPLDYVVSIASRNTMHLYGKALDYANSLFVPNDRVMTSVCKGMYSWMLAFDMSARNSIWQYLFNVRNGLVFKTWVRNYIEPVINAYKRVKVKTYSPSGKPKITEGKRFIKTQYPEEDSPEPTRVPDEDWEARAWQEATPQEFKDTQQRSLIRMPGLDLGDASVQPERIDILNDEENEIVEHIEAILAGDTIRRWNLLHLCGGTRERTVERINQILRKLMMNMRVERADPIGHSNIKFAVRTHPSNFKIERHRPQLLKEILGDVGK